MNVPTLEFRGSMAYTYNSGIVFKVLIIGDAMVGKSCVLHRYADDKFSEQITPTIGVDYRPVYRRIGGHLTKLMVWDTAGQEKFKSITMSFYHGAHGAVIVYDVTQKDTLFRLPNWIAELRRICGDIPLVIIGNKCDRPLKLQIPHEEIDAFIDEIGFTDRHFLASALTAENISEDVLNKNLDILRIIRGSSGFTADVLGRMCVVWAFEALTVILMRNDKRLTISEERIASLRPTQKSRSCFC